MRFSGHESFACRYTWLPKAYRVLSEDPAALGDEERAMVTLGVGKNMVRSIRFWVDVMGVASPQAGRRFELTPFGHAIFGHDGNDPFLEDVRTLWLLHWKVSTHATEPVFAWHFLISHWPYGELTRTEALLAFKRESESRAAKHSDVTLSQHLDVFLHTYVPSRIETSAEDSLDGPLVDLKLLQYVGDRRVGGGGRREQVYAFRREPKPEISSGLFEFCLHDYWQQRHAEEATLTFRDVALAPYSVGQVFKLPEDDVRNRLEVYGLPGDDSPFVYQPSAIQGGLVTCRDGYVLETTELLRRVYEPKTAETRHA
jgi:Protein of unknown function (DUF4007)